MATKPTVDETARLILQILVYDLAMEAGHYVPIRPLQVAFQRRGRAYDDIAGGLEYGRQYGWLTFNADKQTYFLTTQGFSVAEKNDRREPQSANLGAPVVIHGNVGAVQTGPNATANVALSIGDRDDRLLKALRGLQNALQNSSDATPEQRRHGTELVDDIIEAASVEKPNRAKIAGLLGGLATTVQTVASLRDAWSLVRDVALATGIALGLS